MLDNNLANSFYKNIIDPHIIVFWKTMIYVYLVSRNIPKTCDKIYVFLKIFYNQKQGRLSSWLINRLASNLSNIAKFKPETELLILNILDFLA